VSDALFFVHDVVPDAFKTLPDVRGVVCVCYCRLLGAVSDAAHASMMSKLLDQYEQKDNLAQQLEGITKMEV
jgi:hypothetical protein